jgi:hypothetical protein
VKSSLAQQPSTLSTCGAGPNHHYIKPIHI